MIRSDRGNAGGMLKRLTGVFGIVLRPGAAALEALDDPDARRDCPGDACGSLPDRAGDHRARCEKL